VTNYEYILVFRKNGKRKKPENKELSKLTFDEFKEYGMGLWKFGAEKDRRHPAPYPEELPKRLIKLFSYQDELVFDPFMGWGTTMYASQNNRRNSVGIELYEEYCEMIKQRCFGRQFLDRSATYEHIIVDTKE